MRVVPIAAALWAAHALAQSPAPTSSSSPSPDVQYPTYGGSSSTPTASSPSSAAEQPTNWGVLLDAGIPDGIGLSAIFRPMTWLRLGAGGTYNAVSFGVRGGVSVVPFYFPFSPSLNLEVGHFFAGDITPIIQQAFCTDINDPSTCSVTVPTDNPILRQVAYDYANGHLGFEFGMPKTFVFFLRVGLSYIQTELRGFQQVVQETAGSPDNPDTTITAQDLKIRLTAPSLKLGVIVYF